MTTPSAWYPDPHDSTQRRWFDGSVWTDHVLPAPSHVSAAATSSNTAAAVTVPVENDAVTGPKAKRRRRPYIAAVIILALILAVVFVGPRAVAHFTQVAAVSAVPSVTPTPSLKPNISAGQALSSAVTGVPDYGLIAKARQVAASASDPQYADCAAVKAAGKAPIYLGSPGFKAAFDPDGNGIGCDN